MPLFSSSKIIQFFVSDEFRVFVRIILEKKEAEAEDEKCPPPHFFDSSTSSVCVLLSRVLLCLVVFGGGASTHAHGPDRPALGKGDGALEFVFFLLWTRGVSNDFYTPEHIASSSSSTRI